MAILMMLPLAFQGFGLASRRQYNPLPNRRQEDKHLFESGYFFGSRIMMI
jgi:hypothetical protein